MDLEIKQDVKAGDRVEVQLAPRGTFAQIVDGREVAQIVDDAAIAAMVGAFRAEKDAAAERGENFQLLVDADHTSETGGATKAMAWVDELKDDPERGLVGVFVFTPEGAEAVTGRAFRFISPAWMLDADGRPSRLVSVGMTNRPNLPVSPMLNSRAANVAAQPGGDAIPVTADGQTDAGADVGEGGGAPDARDNEKQKGKSTMDEFIKAVKAELGLGEDATVEDVMSAVKAVIARAAVADAVNEACGIDKGADGEQTVESVKGIVANLADLREKAEAAEKAKADADADAFVAENGDLCEGDEEKAALKADYLADAEKAKATVANARRYAERVIANSKAAAAETAKRVVNSAAAKTPTAPADGMAQGLAACNGDPERENAYLRSLAK